MSTCTPRVTITFHGKPVGSQERPSRHSVRRTLTLPAPFTYLQALAAAFVAVQEPEQALDSPAYVILKHRHITNIAFN